MTKGITMSTSVRWMKMSMDSVARAKMPMRKKMTNSMAMQQWMRMSMDSAARAKMPVKKKTPNSMAVQQVDRSMASTTATMQMESVATMLKVKRSKTSATAMV